MFARKQSGMTLEDSRRRDRRESQLRAKAIMIGAPDQIRLADYIDRLERRIEELESRVAAQGGEHE